jgi:hypothetical protein
MGKPIILYRKHGKQETDLDADKRGHLHLAQVKRGNNLGYYQVEWLHPKFPGVPIQHVPVGDPFTFV